MGYRVVRGDEHHWAARPPPAGGPPRLVADITAAAALNASRARVWRYPAGTRGRRHRELAQEECSSCSKAH